MLKSHYFLLALLATSLTSCQLKPFRAATPVAPIPSFRADGGGSPIRRIAVLPPYCNQQTASSVNDLEMTFQSELSKTSLFELVPISHAAMEMHFGKPQISSVDIIPGDLLFRLRSEYGVEGVLFIDITHYFPYGPISIGVRVKLVDATTGKIRRPILQSPTRFSKYVAYEVFRSLKNVPEDPENAKVPPQPAD